MDFHLYPQLSNLEQRFVADKHFSKLDIRRLAILSDFISIQYSKHPNWLSGSNQSTELKQDIENSNSVQALKTSLRLYRNYTLCNLIKKQLENEKFTVEVMRGCSSLADYCINSAVNWLYYELSNQLGIPENEDGEEQTLVVVGMGKLGGRELNLSSDIDLIFCFPDSGNTVGANRAIDNGVFFSKLAQQLVAVLNDTTQDGFVFRVDTRLRPFGASGSLVVNFEAMEHYYLDQGRGWERFAMIKARLITGADRHKEQLMKILKPFIYRRYIDFSMLETPRKIKQQIEAELRRRKLSENLKLGPGGIREIEFIVQAMQLIHGGKLRSLQVTSTLEGLEQLAEHQLMASNDIQQLTASYLKLRHWEHCLQAFADKQTQTLPQDELNQERLSYLADKETWQQWLQMLEQIQQPVHQIFQSQFSDSEREQRLQVVDGLMDLWLVPEESVENLKNLQGLGYTEPHTVMGLLVQLKKRVTEKSIFLSSRSEELFTKLIPEIIRLCSTAKNQNLTMERMLALIEAVQTRTAYLDLFVENKNTLRLLAELFSRSPWIAQHTRQFPLVLDDLLNPNWLNGDEIDDCGNVLLQQISRIPDDDEEQLLDVFREFKQSSYFQLAACFTMETIGMKQLGRHLSNIAQALLQQAYLLARKKVESRYGKLVHDDGSEAEFIVVAMGKLGSHEMGFSSDLDLVFIHDGCEILSGDSLVQGKSITKQIDGFQFFAKLAQRMIHALSIRMSSGVLYEIDTRLRPSGNAGFLVSSIEEYKQYQMTQAWNWEHQALTRARVICGGNKLTQQFEEIRSEILTLPREKNDLRKDIITMRVKMKQSQKKSEKASWNLKQGDGGITDIEFLIQYLLLLKAHEYPELRDNTENSRQLKVLAKNKIITTKQAQQLEKIYIDYLEHHNHQILLESSTVVEEDFTESREKVIKILEQYQLWPWKQ